MRTSLKPRSLSMSRTAQNKAISNFCASHPSARVSIPCQQPHSEDEVYYVISGRASFRAGAEERSVQVGSILYVKANVEHRFHSISEDLRVLVIFAPAEYTNM